MEVRRLGRLGHWSTVAIFGAYALSAIDQDAADAAIALVLQHGVNHFDVARSYGEAEVRLRPWMPEWRRRQVFLATKTEQRARAGAWREIAESWGRLGTDRVDLLQLHAVNSLAELDAVTQPDGALAAAVAAKAQGMVGAIGITGHGHDAPRVHREALRRFPFEPVLTPLNFVLEARAPYRQAYAELVTAARQQEVGLMAIKAIARGANGRRIVFPPITRGIPHSTKRPTFSERSRMSWPIRKLPVLRLPATCICCLATGCSRALSGPG